MKGFYLIATIIILILIAVSMSTSISFSPHVINDLYRKYYPYEGFQSGIGFASTDEVSTPSVPQFNNKKKTPCTKIFGFGGLFCDPHGEETPIDYFSNAKGDLTCGGSGLTNSKGSLCLDKKMTDLLTTRGGNAKGGESYIGN